MTNEKKTLKFTPKDLQYVAAITASALLYSFTMNSFIQSGNLFPGGFSGLSRLISMVCDTYLNISISFSVIYFALNVFVTLFVFNKLGHKFIIYSVLWYTLTSIFTASLDVAPITHEPLLISVFGGLLNGIAMGIALRNNASSGGTDFLAIYLSMKTNLPGFFAAGDITGQPYQYIKSAGQGNVAALSAVDYLAKMNQN